MSRLLKQAFQILFDFKKDVDDLAERLDRAEKTERRLVAEATELHEEIVRLRRENDALRADIDRLKNTGNSD